MVVMPLLARLPRRHSCQVRRSAWGIGILFLLPVLGLGADEQGPIPRSIIGGKPTTVQSYPFVVYVQLPDRRNCTGSIIAPKWILTAAHCLVTSSGQWGSVRVFHGYGADYDLSFRDSKQLFVHPGYRYEFKDQPHRPNDIALIELSPPFPASFATPLGLPRPSAERIYAPSGTSAVTIGYGQTATGPSSYMRSVSASMHHAKDCRDRLDIKNEVQAVHDDTICSGTSTRRAHFGDSGGPLIVAYSGNGGTRWLQIGVANRPAITSAGSVLPAKLRSGRVGLG